MIKIGDIVTAKETPTMRVVKGEFQGYRLQDKENPGSVVDLVLSEDNFTRHTQLFRVAPESIELTESEDERIRKAIIELLKEVGRDDTGISENAKCMIAYLEKQKEATKEEVEPITDGLSTEFQKQVSYLIASSINKEYEYSEGYVKWVSQSLLEYAKFALRQFEKQKEQKPEIKVIIPKFRVGDIIKRVPLEKWDSTIRVESIDEHGYTFSFKHLNKSGGGYIGFAFEKEYEIDEQKPAEWDDLQAYFRNINEAFEEGKEEVVDNPERYGLCKPAEWSEEDEQLIGFVFDLLTDLVWRKDWAMSKEECLERLESFQKRFSYKTK